jgi:replicative DNA helicase
MEDRIGGADVSQFVHTPARAVTQAVREFKRRQNADHRLEWGVKSVDDYLVPMMEGDLISIIGRPGHGKTSTMIYLAKQASEACHRMAEQGTGYDRITVYATWETTIEEFVALMAAQASGQTLEDIARGRADLDRLQDAAVMNIGNRVYIIGKSSTKPSYVPITLTTVDYILRGLREEGKRPLLLECDYLQRIPADDKGKSKRESVEQNVELAKDIGLNHGCPVALGVQAGRSVDDQSGVQMPTLTDAQWSSAIEQTSDKLIGETRPAIYMEEGSDITYRDSTIEVTDNLMVLRVIKQRWGPVGRTFFLHFDPKQMIIGEMAFNEELGF